jgi:multicomponent Na+:H+ antiporter subunit B
MEVLLSFIIGFMIIAAIVAIHAKDLLSAIISQGFVGYGLVICFLLLKAPDLAIVQIVVETVTLIIMVAVVLDSSRKELDVTIDKRQASGIAASFLFAMALLFYFNRAISGLDRFGDHTFRMSQAYVNGAAEQTGSINLVAGVLWDFRGYDTLGEATVLFTAAIGVITIIRLVGKK